MENFKYKLRSGIEKAKRYVNKTKEDISNLEIPEKEEFKYKLNRNFQKGKEQVYRAKEYISNLNPKERLISLVLAGSIALGGIGYIIKQNLDEDNIISLVDVDDAHENNFHLYDAEGKEIEVVFDDMSKVLAILNKSQGKNNGRYEVTLVDEDGKMQTGFVDEEYLSKKIIQKIDLSKTPFNVSKDSIESFDETYVVSAKSGAWLRPNTILDTNSDEPIQLKSGTYVLGGDSTVISADNDYSWRKCIVYDNGELKTGYIADEYLMNTDFSKAKGDHFTVSSPIGLKLRSGSDTNSDVILKLNNGEEVILVPHISTKSTDKYDWFYIAAERNGDVVLGYSAATQYKGDGTIVNYLIPHEIEETEVESDFAETEKHSVVTLVDTSEVGGVPLKLREQPSTDSSIVARIENGALINTTKEALEAARNSEEKNNEHRWLEVELVTGEKGYVAVEYLKDYTQTNENYHIINAKFGGKSYQGYFGIDVNATGSDKVTPGSIGEILSKNHTYKKDDSFAVGTDLKKPDFVIIKMGSTSQGGDFTIMQDRVKKNGKVEKPETYYKKVLSIAQECEKMGVPYGFYYYSQATNAVEAKKEMEYIEGFFKKAGHLRYNILPFGFDVEQGYTAESGSPYRNMTFVKKYSKEAYTSVVNSEMNELRSRLAKYGVVDVILYTDHNVLLPKEQGGLIEYKSLDKQNKQLWMVQPNDTHYNYLNQFTPEAIPNILIRQSELDVDVKTAVKGNMGVDYDFIEKSVFEKFLRDGLGIQIDSQSNQHSRESERER